MQKVKGFQKNLIDAPKRFYHLNNAKIYFTLIESIHFYLQQEILVLLDKMMHFRRKKYCEYIYSDFFEF